MLKKTAIAIDAEAYRDLDAMARERGTTRNRLIGDLLRLAVEARENRRITDSYDRVFAEHVQKAEEWEW